MPFHQRTQRWACLVAHRRAGKTVAAVNDLICVPVGAGRGALMKVGNYAYIAPFRSQAKSVAWDYVKKYAEPIIKPKSANEAELKITLINGSTLQLFGADNADAMRGLGFDGVYLDEYGDFRPSVWGNVIRPTLSDKKGWAVFAGTPKGHNQFYDIYRIAKSDPGWYQLTLKASDSGILDKEELTAAASQLSEDQYNQEYECSFDAAILGAYYGKEMTRVDAEGRIRVVEHDPNFPVNTAWDIGRTDDTAIWWYQNIGQEIHVLDWYAESGGSVENFNGERFEPGSLVDVIRSKPYRYGRHWLPHDARAKTLASDGKSVMEKLAKYLGFSSLGIAPHLSVQDGIEAVRTVLGRCYFDHKCNPDSQSGIEALRQYQREYNEDSKAFMRTPKHDWTSHSADAFRMLAVAERQSLPSDPVIPREQKQIQTIQRMLDEERNVTLDELWERSERRTAERVRI